MKKTSKKLLRRFLRDLDILIVSVAIILLWRGVWNFIDMYFFPEFPVFSNMFTILLGILVIFLHNFNLKELER